MLLLVFLFCILISLCMILTVVAVVTVSMFMIDCVRVIVSVLAVFYR